MEHRPRRRPAFCSRTLLSRIGVKRGCMMESKALVTIGIKPIPWWLSQCCSWRSSERIAKCFNQGFPPNLERIGGVTDCFYLLQQSNVGLYFLGVKKQPRIRSCGRWINYISAPPAKVISEVLSPMVEPFLFAMDGLSISIAHQFTNRSPLPTVIAYKLEQSLIVTRSRCHFHFWDYLNPPVFTDLSLLDTVDAYCVLITVRELAFYSFKHSNSC